MRNIANAIHNADQAAAIVTNFPFNRQPGINTYILYNAIDAMLNGRTPRNQDHCLMQGHPEPEAAFLRDPLVCRYS